MIDDVVKKHSLDYCKKIFLLSKSSIELAVIGDCNVLSKVVINRPNRTIDEVTNKKEKFLTTDELREVLNELRSLSPLVADVCEFQSLTGLRFGELAALREEDYNGNDVFVNATLVWPRRKGDRPHRGTPKNIYSVRHVLLDGTAKKIVERYLLKNKRRRLWEPTVYDKQGETYIFTTREGGPVDICFVNKFLRKTHCPKKLSTHIFRHTHISFLAMANVPIKAIMDRVGHNDPETTLAVYTHVSQEMKRTTVKAVEKIGKQIKA